MQRSLARKNDPGSISSMKTAVITGAGSGVGRALAIDLSNAGWRLVLIGRDPAKLSETAMLCPEPKILIEPCDIGDAKAVEAMGKRVLDAVREVDVLVNAAGT